MGIGSGKARCEKCHKLCSGHKTGLCISCRTSECDICRIAFVWQDFDTKRCRVHKHVKNRVEFMAKHAIAGQASTGICIFMFLSGVAVAIASRVTSWN